MKLEKNIGPDDRYTRFIIGLGLFLNIFSLEPTVPVIFLLIFMGASFWISAWTGNSLLYHFFKINTAGRAAKNDERPGK